MLYLLNKIQHRFQRRHGNLEKPVKLKSKLFFFFFVAYFFKQLFYCTQFLQQIQNHSWCENLFLGRRIRNLDFFAKNFHYFEFDLRHHYADFSFQHLIDLIDDGFHLIKIK